MMTANILVYFPSFFFEMHISFFFGKYTVSYDLFTEHYIMCISQIITYSLETSLFATE